MESEYSALTKRRLSLLKTIAKASDEIGQIDDRLSGLLEGRKPGAGAA